MHPDNQQLIERFVEMKKEAEARGAKLTYHHDCILSGLGIKYWEFIPQLFNDSWSTDITETPCPLRMPYQLVRNILIACVRDGKADPKNGHAVLLYDQRNPAFQVGGKGRKAFDQVRDGLKDENKNLMQECTWQQIVGAIRKDTEMSWLVAALRDKYGIE